MEGLFCCLKRLRSSNSLFIVEGVKDRAALFSLGIFNVVVLDRPLFAVVDLVCSRCDECVVLTDLDSEGRKLFSRLSSELVRRGVKVDNSLRHLYVESFVGE